MPGDVARGTRSSMSRNEMKFSSQGWSHRSWHALSSVVLLFLWTSCGGNDPQPQENAGSVVLDVTTCIPPSSPPTALSSCIGAQAPSPAPLVLQPPRVDVTSEMVHLYSSVKVEQLTHVAANMISYYDVPAVIPGSDRFVYTGTNRAIGSTGDPLYAAALHLGGTAPDARMITDSAEATANAFLTPDGAMAYFPKLRGSVMDVKAVALNGSTCAETTIAKGLPAPLPGSVLELSTASRSCATGKWVIALGTSEAPRPPPHDFDSGRVYRYKGKGADPTSSWTLFGSHVIWDEFPKQPFHGLRLSPTCPNILMYSRNRPDGHGDKDIYVADLDTVPTTPYYLAFGENATGGGANRKFPSHEMWSNDGLQVSYTYPTTNRYTRELFVGNIVNPDCTLRTINPNGSSNLEGTAGLAARTFKGTQITRNSLGVLLSEIPKFCSWSADDQHFACSGYQFEGGDVTKEGDSSIFLVNRWTGVRRFLVRTHEQPDSSEPGVKNYYSGQSHLQFAGDKATILFDSDRLTAGNVRLAAQIYKLTYAPSLLP